MVLYKWPALDGSSFNGGTGKWSLPKHRGDDTWTPGRWRRRIKDIEPCARGYHLCREQDLLWWIGPALWEAEADGDLIEHGSASTGDSKIVVGRARLLRPVTTWTERTAQLFAADCAEQVLPIFEGAHPGDDRPRRAIAITRAYANGAATFEELAAAMTAASTAARAAASTAAWAARAATGTAASTTAGTAAGTAARAAAWKWQHERLMAYLTGAVS